MSRVNNAPSELDLPGRPPPPIFQMHLENNEETHAAWLRLLERTTRDIESSHSFAAPFVHFSGTSASDHAIPPTNPGNFCPSANEIVQIMYHNTHPSLRMPPPSDALPAIPAARPYRMPFFLPSQQCEITNNNCVLHPLAPPRVIVKLVRKNQDDGKEGSHRRGGPAPSVAPAA